MRMSRYGVGWWCRLDLAECRGNWEWKVGAGLVPCLR